MYACYMHPYPTAASHINTRRRFPSSLSPPPTPPRRHVPGYLHHFEALRSLGVDKVICVAVNDPYVMNAWGEALKTGGRIEFLADPSAAFARALGLEVDLSAAALGIRSTRYSLLVDDGIILRANVEEKPADLLVSDGGTLVRQLEEDGRK